MKMRARIRKLLSTARRVCVAQPKQHTQLSGLSKGYEIFIFICPVPVCMRFLSPYYCPRAPLYLKTFTAIKAPVFLYCVCVMCMHKILPQIERRVIQLIYMFNVRDRLIPIWDKVEKGFVGMQDMFDFFFP